MFAVIAGFIQLSQFFYLMVDRRWEKRPTVVSLTPFLLLLAFVWTCFLLLLARFKGLVRSPAVWVYVAASTLFSAVNNYLLDNGQIAESNFETAADSIYLLVMTILLILCSMPDRPFLLKEGVQFSPRELVSFPSLFTFSWVNRLAYDGWRSVIGYDELMPLAERDRARYLGPLLRTRLIRRVELEVGINRGVLQAIYKTFAWPLLSQQC